MSGDIDAGMRAVNDPNLREIARLQGRIHELEQPREAMKPVPVSANLLAAMTSCCDDFTAHRWTSSLLMTEREIVACNGKMLVRLEMDELAEAKAGRVAINRAFVEMAVAAQDRYWRDQAEEIDGIEGGIIRVPRTTRGARTIGISWDRARKLAWFDIANSAGPRVKLEVPLRDHEQLESDAPLDAVSQSSPAAAPPEYMFDARYMDMIHEVARAAYLTRIGLKIAGWGADGRSPIKFTCGPMTAILMPMVEPGRAS